MPFDPSSLVTVSALLTLVGNGIIVTLVVELVKRTAALSDAQIARFGPVLAIATGIVLSLAAAAYLARPLADAVMLGFVSGAVASGLYAALGEEVGKVVETVTGGRVS
jgi:hypothetical protein